MNLMSASSLILGGERLLSTIQLMNRSLKKNDYTFYTLGHKIGSYGFKGDYLDEG